MLKSIFAVLDLKSAVFANPFTSVNDATALRSFHHAATDPNSEISAYPEDYILYKIGTYDDVLGTITPVQPENLGTAVTTLITKEC